VTAELPHPPIEPLDGIRDSRIAIGARTPLIHRRGSEKTDEIDGEEDEADADDHCEAAPDDVKPARR
jgi:hypothetical protein